MLYNPSQDKDNCGFGLIAHLEGQASHKVVRTAISGLARMQHRQCDPRRRQNGDGCGFVITKPDRFFQMIAAENEWRLARNYAVGMLFLSQDRSLHKPAAILSKRAGGRNACLSQAGVKCRSDRRSSAKSPLAGMPQIEQVFINAPGRLAGCRDLERRLFYGRRQLKSASAAGFLCLPACPIW